MQKPNRDQDYCFGPMVTFCRVETLSVTGRKLSTEVRLVDFPFVLQGGLPPLLKDPHVFCFCATGG
jgi:hypothetical protein